MGYRYNFPLDPDCPDARREVYDAVDVMSHDPMTAYYGVDVGEFSASWEESHRKRCKRCQEYGAANVEVID